MVGSPDLENRKKSLQADYKKNIYVSVVVCRQTVPVVVCRQTVSLVILFVFTGDDSGVFPDKMTKEDFMKLHGLDQLGYQMVKASNLEAIQCILIAEHNEVVGEHEPLTPKGLVQYCRAQVWLACTKENIDFPPKLEQIPEKARANIEQFTKMDRGTYYKRMKIALLPEELWKNLESIWDLYEHNELKGQNPKAVSKELPIRSLELLVSKLTPDEVDRVFNDLLTNTITPKQITDRANLAATQTALREVIFFYARFDPKKQEMDPRNPQHDQKLLDFVENSHYSSYNSIVNTFMETGNRKNFKLLNLPWGKETTRCGLMKQTVKKYDLLPPMVQTWIQRGRAYITPNEPQALPATGNTFTIETSKYQFAPMKFIFLQQDLCDAPSVLAGLGPADREYEAAHLQLPMGGKVGGKADKLLGIDQIRMVINTITTMCSASSLVLQLWCHSDQHTECKIILMESFDTVEMNFWQKPLASHHPSKKATGFLPDDLLYGFIASKRFDFTCPPIYVKMCPRPSVVFAPAVKKLSVARIDDQRVTCSTEMNPMVPKQFYDKYSRQDALVADFMCGSGSAAVAAASLGRSCLVVDLDKSMVCFVS